MWGGKFPTIKASVLCAKFQSNNDHLLSCPIGSAARDCRLGLTNCPCVIATIIRVLNYLFVHIAVRLVCVKFCSKPAEQSFLVILALLLFYMRCVCVCMWRLVRFAPRVMSSISKIMWLHHPSLFISVSSGPVQQKPFFFSVPLRPDEQIYSKCTAWKIIRSSVEVSGLGHCFTSF